MQCTVIFDLDGTLVDSVPDIHAALNRLMASRALAPFSLVEVAGFVGDGVAVLLRRAFAARGGSPDAAAFADFMLDYEANAAVLTRPYPGIPALLEALVGQGWRLAICTNKPEQAARILLEQLGLSGLFSALGGGDSFVMRKPDPGHLLAVLAAAGGDAAAAVMIGDHHNDMQAARGAGLPAIFCAWGYGTLGMAEGAPVAEAVSDLPSLLARVLPGCPGLTSTGPTSSR